MLIFEKGSDNLKFQQIFIFSFFVYNIEGIIVFAFEVNSSYQ